MSVLVSTCTSYDFNALMPAVWKLWHCDTWAMLSKDYGGDAMKTSSVFEWHKQFKGSHQNMEDDERSGCPRSYRND
jgi:hypothetical protein